MGWVKKRMSWVRFTQWRKHLLCVVWTTRWGTLCVWLLRKPRRVVRWACNWNRRRLVTLSSTSPGRMDYLYMKSLLRVSQSFLLCANGKKGFGRTSRVDMRREVVYLRMCGWKSDATNSRVESSTSKRTTAKRKVRQLVISRGRNWEV